MRSLALVNQIMVELARHFDNKPIPLGIHRSLDELQQELTGVPVVWGGERPSKPETYLQMAEVLAQRATCRRLKVGALLVTGDLHRIISFGYNGNARGLVNDCDTAEAGACGCVHAEANCLMFASPTDLRGATLFVTHSPCVACAKLLVTAQVGRVFYRQQYRNLEGLEVLNRGQVATYLLDSAHLWVDNLTTGAAR